MKKISLYIMFSLIIGVGVYAVIYSGFFDAFTNSVSDSFYQRNSTPDERIVIIGIDGEALERFGEFPWDRDIFAKAIEHLNKDPENSPAVIGIDVLFTTTSENDAKLIEVSERYDNLVFSSYAEFESSLDVISKDIFYIDDYGVSAFHSPIDGINESSQSGHVNAMIDSDGILRHALYEIELQDGEKIPSFNRVIAEKYQATMNAPLTEAPILDVNGHWYVVQQSVPGAYYDEVSVADLVDGSVDPDYFADKIVLIGSYAPGLLDDYFTPISSFEKMYGVEYQANAVSALLTGTTKTTVNDTLHATIAMIITISFFYFCVEKKFLHTLILWGSGCLLWILISLLLFELGYIMPIAFVPLILTASFIIITGLNYSIAYVEKRKISRTFEKYLAPQIVTELLKNDPESITLGGKVTNVAVMFADMRGFTPLATKLPPELVTSIINRFLSVCGECIFRYDGTLDKYLGDSAMAFWGAPLPQTQSAYKAVKAGIDIIKETEKLSVEIEKEYGFSLEVGIGISYGEAVVGNIGSISRMDYTVIGDTVNIAARMEQAAPGGAIYIGRNTANELDNSVPFVKVTEDIKLQGKEDGFEIFSIIIE